MSGNTYKITNPSEQKVDDSKFVVNHPGGWIKRNVLAPYNLTVSEAARLIRSDRATLSNVLNGKHDVSRDLAFKLEALTGVDAEIMLGLQREYDRHHDLERRGHYRAAIERLELPT